MGKSRTYNGIRNVIVSFGGTVFNIILQFIGRVVFVRFLTTEYLGLNGLFADVLNILALSELGIGSAMVYAMYKPVAENDHEKIKSLMALYKKMYMVIGCIILTMGALITPFLAYIIKDMPDMPLIHVYFILYVVNTGISYFFAYKKSLIICYQEEYVATIVSMVTSILNRVIQILVLIVSHSFLLYLIVQITFTFLENLCNSYIADKKYPYLKDKRIQPLAKDDVFEIKKNIKAMMAHKIGTVIVKSTDSMIISKLLGLTVLGLYSNYNLIIYNITTIVQKMFWTLTASFGNLVAEGDTKKSRIIFNNLLFMAFWIHCFCAISIICMIEPFIAIWLGDNYLLGMNAVVIFSVCFFIEGIRQPALLMRDATGVFYRDRYKPLVEALVNLLASVPLTYRYGIVGVKLGTIISYVAVALWVEGYILFKYYFKESVLRYLLKIAGYFLGFAGLSVITFELCSLVNVQGILSIALRAVICVVCPNLIIIIVCRKKSEYQYFLGLLKKVLPGKKK